MQIELKNVSFSYGVVPTLHDVSFSVRQGALVAVLGPNGAGKSTLFRCILRLLKPSAGTIRLCGEDTAAIDRRRLAKLAAYIPQSSTPVFNYTVEDAVLMGTTGALSALQAPSRTERERCARALEQLGISDLAQRGIAQLSGGERQLALIARALVQDARVLIMDEPTANLDYGNQRRVMQQVRALADGGYTILLSTHNPEHALHYATQVLALQNGRVIADGATADTLTPELLARLYGIRAEVRRIDGHTVLIPLD